MRLIGMHIGVSVAGTILLGTAFLASSAASDYQSFKTSFDCARAASEAEKTICGTRELADADVEMASIYKSLLSGFPAVEKDRLKHEQLDWLRARNKCGSAKNSIDCIKQLYSQRIEVFHKQKEALEESPAVYTKDFISPDKSCHLLYKGPESSGEGVFYDVTNGGKEAVHKGYLRIGPMVNWMSNSIAELFVSEGSPAYHSYYYDCHEHRASPSYFQSIAFDPKTKVVATLEEGEIVFYRLFSDREFYRAKTPDIDMMEYLAGCDSNASFEGDGTLHITMKKCNQGHDVDLRIKVPD
jgi:uncharacterized protein